MTIRLRAPEDLTACVAVLAEVHRQDGYPEVWPSDATGWLDPAATLAAWVAETAGEITGHVSLVAEPGNHPVMLSRLFVSPRAQGRGTARQLMAAVLDHAAQRGQDVMLEVYAETPAVAVYERLGWRFLTSGQASWTGRDGRHPTVRYYAAPEPAENL